MTLISSSSSGLFSPSNKFIKYSKDGINVVNGPNTLASLPLCGVKNEYEQYQRLSIQIPKGATDFELDFEKMLGSMITFLAIKPNYSGTNPEISYLKWKFLPSIDSKWSLTTILTLTGTTDNPIPTLLIDNPNEDCIVQLDVLVGALKNDIYDDEKHYTYFNNLNWNDILTYANANTGILAIWQNGELKITVDLCDCINVNSISNSNRIIIDESSENNIILDFKTVKDKLWALSRLTWLLHDPSNRALTPLEPPRDEIAPTISFNSSPEITEIDVCLNNYSPGIYSKLNFKADLINNYGLSINDNFDDVAIDLQLNNITFVKLLSPTSVIVLSITEPGNYLATITVNDIAGNYTTKNINLNVQNECIEESPEESPEIEESPEE